MISTSKVTGRLNGSKVGMVGALFGLITGILALSVFIEFRIISIMGPMGPRWLDSYSAFLTLHWIMEVVCIGGTAFLIGPFFIVYREYFLRDGLWIVSGVVFMLSGIFYSCFYSYYYSYFVYYPGFPQAQPMLSGILLAVSYGSILFGSILGAVAFLAGRPVGKSIGKPVEDTEN